ncbi:alpha/beta hydrolase [Aestuariivirga sp.]|uniref:alpha/beta hydrolase n=1 Tax=Aestuariivirga sp. TaxID=2650926 RepID=UPI0039E37329
MMKDPFRTRDHVPEFDALVEEYRQRSTATRSTLPMKAGIAYGDGGSQTLDLFIPSRMEDGAPVHLFIHGGYWRMFAKEDFSFVADTVTACGAIAAVMDYDLMPGVRMDTIVVQVRRAVDWLAHNIARHGGDPARLSVSGHSAGGHLGCFTLAVGSPVKAAFLLSGLYDLKPLQASFLAPLIGITDEEAATLSPLKLKQSVASQVIIATGAHETPPFHAQASAFRAHLAGQGVDVAAVLLPGLNHMSAMRDLGMPDSSTGTLLRRLILST